jgi:hypothetical protein
MRSQRIGQVAKLHASGSDIRVGKSFQICVPLALPCEDCGE